MAPNQLDQRSALQWQFCPEQEALIEVMEERRQMGSELHVWGVEIYLREEEEDAASWEEEDLEEEAAEEEESSEGYW